LYLQQTESFESIRYAYNIIYVHSKQEWTKYYLYTAYQTPYYLRAPTVSCELDSYISNQDISLLHHTYTIFQVRYYGLLHRMLLTSQ